MASPWPTLSATTTSTMRQTARGTRTARTTTARGTAGSKARPTTPTSWPFAPGKRATSWPRWPCRSASRCSSVGTNWGARQQGNNNAYCQDNEVSWYDWENVDADLLAWTRAVLNLRRKTPCFPAAPLFPGPTAATARFGPGLADIGWFRPDGRLMTDADWGVGVRQVPGRAAQRRFAERTGPAWPAGGRLLVLPGLQRLGRAASVPPPGPEMGRAVAGRGRHLGQQAGSNARPASRRESRAAYRATTSSCWSAASRSLSRFATQPRELGCTAQKNGDRELDDPGTTTFRSEFWLLFVLTT